MTDEQTRDTVYERPNKIVSQQGKFETPENTCYLKEPQLDSA